MSKKAVIFDLDGTLVNSLTDIAVSTNYALAEMHFPTHSNEKILSFVGRGIRNLITDAMPEYAKNNEIFVNQCLNHFMEHYGTHCCNHTKPYPNIENMLQQLQQKGIKMAVLSNKSHNFTKLVVNELGLSKFFAIVLGMSDKTPKKPDPTGTLRICKELNISPCEAIFVGDSKFDMMTAQNAQMDSIWVSWGFASYESITEYSPTFSANSPEEIFSIVTK